MGPNSRYSFPFTLLTRGAYRTESGLTRANLNFLRRETYNCSSINDFFPEKSKLLHQAHNGGPPSSSGGGYLHFLGWPPGQYFPLIRSSFDDLLLVEKTRKDFYVCNPLTRQWDKLPEAPTYPEAEAIDIVYRSGFVCETDSNRCNESYYCNCSIKYSVVVLGTDHCESVYHAAVFSSETGQWTESTFQFPVRLNVVHWTPVGCNGIVYWPYGSNSFRGIVAFDPSSSTTDDSERRCRMINLPREFGRDWRARSHRARLGAVRGRLRLLQLFWHARVNSFVLRAWDLDPTTSSWLLVHDLQLRRSEPNEFWHPLALHPDDEDVLFIMRTKPDDQDLDVCQYRIGQDLDTCELLYQLPHFRCLPSLCVFTLVHPWWPTAIPPQLPPI